jgi:DNA-directed RNA polymerase specialized sigma24 family protein
MDGDSSQASLVAKAVEGDHVALERLLLTEYERLARHIRSRLPANLQSTISIEDILQEAFVDAFRSISDFVPASEHAFSSWILSIADHRFRDAIRRHNRKKRGVDFRQVTVPGGSEDSSIADLAAIFCSDGPTPSRVAARKEAIEAVQVSLAGLTKPIVSRRPAQSRFLLMAKCVPAPTPRATARAR